MPQEMKTCRRNIGGSWLAAKSIEGLKTAAGFKIEEILKEALRNGAGNKAPVKIEGIRH
jgi:hypothetical protein